MAARAANHAAAELPDGASALSEEACRVLALAARRGISIATAESCTGGLLASLLTDKPGLSKWFDRGFVVYTDEAKCEVLGIAPIEIARHGAVSGEIAKHLAKSALTRSHAGVAAGITGFAGSAGPRNEAGLVYLAVVDQAGRTINRECHFGDAGRDRTRFLAAQAGLEMLAEALSSTTD